MRENHYAISCIKSKISQVSNYKMSITLLIFPKCRAGQRLASAKLVIFCEMRASIAEKYYRL